MSNANFIEEIGAYVKKHAPFYNICVYSPIIAQAILESASGTSELAIKANNFFGLKWRANRCPSSDGHYIKNGSEQNPDGSYSSSVMKWFSFPDMEAGVRGYFDFINISNYANLKGVTDPETYLRNIKADGYATSLKYVENLMNVIQKYDLTHYDNIEETEETVMKINVHAGHNPDGKVACGAVGLIKESTEARKVKNEVISQLRQLGHTVYDCTVDNGTSVSDVLKKIVGKANSNNVDLDVSIHFNAGANDKTGNGKNTGTEVLIYSTSSRAKTYAINVCEAISNLGFKNRGVKTRSDLYVLKNTKAPAILIECCFVDDKDDVELYNYKEMASAIVYGITGKKVVEKEESNLSTGTEKNTVTGTGEKLYRVQCGAYKIKENAEALKRQLQADGYPAIIVNY